MNPRLKILIGAVVFVHITSYFMKPFILPEKQSNEEKKHNTQSKLMSNLNSSMPQKLRVLLTRPDIEPSSLELLKSSCDVLSWGQNSPAPRDFVLENISGVSALLCFLTDRIDRELLDLAGPNLKVVSTFSVGYDHIDVEECKKRRIKIGYTPDVLTEATAELTIGLLLSTSRRLVEANNEAKTGGWKTWAPFWLTGPGLMQSTVGIVGFGRIGQSVARKIKAFEAKRILYYNRSDKSKEASIVNAERCDFNTLLQESDFVICSCALTSDTKELFDKNAFAKMKTNAIFINTSRGGLVNQDDLIEALTSRKIKAAGLDVTTPEPLPLDNPLFSLPNVVILPHIGSASLEARTAMSNMAVNNIITGLNDKNMPAELFV